MHKAIALIEVPIHKPKADYIKINGKAFDMELHLRGMGYNRTELYPMIESVSKDLEYRFQNAQTAYRLYF